MTNNNKVKLPWPEVETLLFNLSNDSSDENLSDIENETSICLPDCSFTDCDENATNLESELENRVIGDPFYNNPLSWTPDVTNDFDISEFIGCPGPIHNLPPGSSCLDYFRLFFDDDLCEKLIENTNEYAEFCSVTKNEKDRFWTPISNKNELWAFLGILMIVSIVQMPKLFDYWSSNAILGHELVKKLMPRKRFAKILQYFHISDRAGKKPIDTSHFVYYQEVEAFISILKHRYQKNFSPYKELLVGEILLEYKDRLGIMQHMLAEPAKPGMKVWILRTSYLGYVYNFDVYCGRKHNINVSSDDLGYNLALHLTEPLKGKFHEIYLEKSFSSTKLMLDLMKNGFYSCGIVTPNCAYLPRELSTLELKIPGTCIVFQCNEEKNLLCTSWMDKEKISVLSTNVKTSDKRVNSGKDCPNAFIKYDKHMGGLNLADERRKYTSPQKFCKWWYCLFWFLLDTTIVNSFITMSVTNFPHIKKPLDLKTFKLLLIEQIVSKFTSEIPSIMMKSSEHVHIRRKISGRKRTCVKCRKIKRFTISGRPIESSWECEICSICMCKGCFNCV